MKVVEARGRTDDWVEVLARRDAGIERAARRATPEWVRTSAEYLRWYATRVAHGQPFLLEDAREVSSIHGIEHPANERAWGAAVRHAAACGWIVKNGYAPARSSNGSPKCLWKATNFKR